MMGYWDQVPQPQEPDPEFKLTWVEIALILAALALALFGAPYAPDLAALFS